MTIEEQTPEELAFEESLDPEKFETTYRPLLYASVEDLPESERYEAVADLSRKYIVQNAELLWKKREQFYGGMELHVLVKNYHFDSPFGLAAGFDKNLELMYGLSAIMGHLTLGTITLSKRDGNAPPRLKADPETRTIWNAMGFNQIGLTSSVIRFKKYRMLNIPKVPIFTSVCAIPNSIIPSEALEQAYEETMILADVLAPHSDALELNFFTPNTDVVRVLRDKDLYAKVAKEWKKRFPELLKFAKLGPVASDADEKLALDLAGAWNDNGGDGLMLTNTRMVKSPEGFSREFCGESGTPLRDYSLKTIELVHPKYPEQIIKGGGGIITGQNAWKFFEAGATLEDLFSGLVFRGPGIIKEFNRVTKHELKQRGLSSLSEYFEKRDSKLN